MPGLGLRLGLRARYRRRLALRTLREQVEGLRDRSTVNGRTSTAALKVPGTDPLPTGITRSGSLITIGSYTGDLEDWDFRGYSLQIRAVMGALRQCVFGELPGTPAGLSTAYIDVYVGARVAAVENNDLIGPATFGGAGTAINCRFGGTAAAPTSGRIPVIRRNRLTGLTSDGIKAVGDPDAAGQVVEWNYFGPPVNLSAVPTQYASGTTYAPGDLVWFGSRSKVWRARSAGQHPAPPPDKTGAWDDWEHVSPTPSPMPAAHVAGASYAANALVTSAQGEPWRARRTTRRAPPATVVGGWTYWQNLDPHADAITTVMVRNRLTIARNLFDFVPRPGGADPEVPQVGVNNQVRLSRNSGDWPVEEVLVEENVTFHTQDEASFPLHAETGGEPNFNGPVRFRNNWLGKNSGGSYFHASTNGLVDEWTGNRDSASDATVPGPSLRVRGEAPVAVEPPAVSGTRQVGQTLAATAGTWGGTTPIAFAYRWLRGTTPIGGATAATYAQVAADAGQEIAVEVTATNAHGSALATSAAGGVTAPAGPILPPKMTFGFMGRSNMEYLTANAPFYIDTAIPRPSFAARAGFRANCTFVGMNPEGGSPGEGPIVEVAIDESTKGSQVNMGMLAVAEWLGRAKPGTDFMLKAWDKGGTTIEELAHDGEAVGDTDPYTHNGQPRTFVRTWEKVRALQDHKHPEWGDPSLVQCIWLGSTDYFDDYAPIMLRQLEDGTPFALGSTNPIGNTPLWSMDHCIFDANVPVAERGEGVWPRTVRFHEMRREDSAAFDAALNAFRSDPRNAHWVEPLGASDAYMWDDGHALKTTIFGQYYGGLQLIPAIARELGFEVKQPQEYRQVTSADGLVTDIFVKLPNGGDLTTPRRRTNAAASAFPAPFPATPLPWQHEVSSLSVKRPGGAQTRIHRRDLPTDAAGLAAAPLASRATVTLRDPGTGTGAAREGCIRIAWEQPVPNGTEVYVRHKFGPGHNWQAEMPFLDFPIETVPAITFDDLLVPFPGLGLRPWMPPLVVTDVVSAGPTLRGHAMADNGVSGPVAAPAAPSGTAEGDLVLLIGGSFDGDPSSTTPAGWTLVHARNSGAYVRLFAKVWAAGDAIPALAGAENVAVAAVSAGTHSGVSGLLVESATQVGNAQPVRLPALAPARMPALLLGYCFTRGVAGQTLGLPAAAGYTVLRSLAGNGRRLWGKADATGAPEVSTTGLLAFNQHNTSLHVAVLPPG